MTKHERIELHKKRTGNKPTRYSDSFNEVFTFFLQSYRKGLLTFCGSIVNVEFDINELEGKNIFRKYDNGDYQQGKPIISKHPNIVKAVITGKKSWGLWSNTWVEGIVDWSFTKEEILNEFSSKNITIPKPLLTDFENKIFRLKLKRNENLLNCGLRNGLF